jgi:hypothetical protein
MIELAIRQWILEQGSKEDALRFLGYIEGVNSERIKKCCEELREYINSDSCGLNNSDQALAQKWQEFLSSPEAERLPEGNPGAKELNGMDEEE